MNRIGFYYNVPRSVERSILNDTIMDIILGRNMMSVRILEVVNVVANIFQ